MVVLAFASPQKSSDGSFVVIIVVVGISEATQGKASAVADKRLPNH